MKVFLKFMSAALVFALAVCMVPSARVSALTYENVEVKNNIDGGTVNITAPSKITYLFTSGFSPNVIQWTIDYCATFPDGLGTKYHITTPTGHYDSNVLSNDTFGSMGEGAPDCRTIIDVDKPGTYTFQTKYDYYDINEWVNAGYPVYTINASAVKQVRGTDSAIIKAATCSETGSKIPDTYNEWYKWGDEYYSDEACTNQITLETIPIDSNAHNWGEWTEVTPANCVEKGTLKRVCLLNSEHSETEYTNIAPNNHKSALIYVEEKAPTISSTGEKAHWECSDCGKKYLDKDGKNQATDADLVIDKLVYTFKASEYKWSKGSNSGCSLTADNNYSGIEADEKFDSLYIDGGLVANTNYSLDKGSVIITLKPSYLNTLKNGEHTVKAVFSDGGEAETVLRIVNESTDSPSTGDNTMLMPVWVILILSMMSAAYFFMKGHYAKQKAFISTPSSDN